MKYGDYGNVTKDSRILIEILHRQGSHIFLEVLADSIGEASIKFKLPFTESLRVMESMRDELKELTLERI